MDVFMQILTMLFPAGIGSIVTWMFSRNLYRAKKKKEVHDIYQVMYNDVCTTLTHIKDENRKLYQIVERFEKQYSKLQIVAIGMIALCVMSCRSQQNLQMQSDYQGDSLRSRKKVELALMPVPPSQAKLKLIIPQIKSLPIGAGYMHQSGRAIINITKTEGDTLFLTATCDSLQREYLRLEEELVRFRDFSTYQSTSLMTRGPTGWQFFWICFGNVRQSFYLLSL